jgi:hypothetical protein
VGGGKCQWTGKQEISNLGGEQALGWHWQAISPVNPTPSLNMAYFKWGFSSSPGNTGLPYTNSQAAGVSATLYLTFRTSCPSGNPKYTVQMYDSLNRSYSFPMDPS